MIVIVLRFERGKGGKDKKTIREREKSKEEVLLDKPTP